MSLKEKLKSSWLEWDMSKSPICAHVEFEYGFAVRVNEENQGPYPLFGSNGITGFIDSYKVEGPGVIIGRKGSVGKVVYTEDNFTPTDTAYYLKIKDKTRNDLKFWSFLLPQLGIDKLNSHSAVPGLSRQLAYLVEYDIPSIDQQIKVSNVLSFINMKLALNNKINTELEAMAKLIYDYWFVQFDFPDANGKPYKSSGGKMIYNKALKREIPAGWKGDIIGNILSSDLGGTPSTKVKEYWGGNIPWLNSGEIAKFPVIEAEEHITSDAIEKSATSLMPKGTCVLSITRHLRPSILAIEACANQSVVGIYESEKLKSTFLYPYLKNEIPRLMSLRTGAQQPHINKGIVDESPIIIPSDEPLNIYYEKVKGIYEQIDNNAFQNKELGELRDWLLPMLMNGQVTVKDM